MLRPGRGGSGREEWSPHVVSTCVLGHVGMRAVFVLCCVRLKLVLKGEIKPVVCFSSIFFLLFLLLSSVNNSTVHTSTVWNGCLQDHLNKNKRNLQLLMIEKKIDDILQHWRSRIGLEKKQVVSSTCFPSLA